MKYRIIIVLLLSILLESCNVEPKKIEYGNDHCFNCDMTVVDKTHAAEYVTKKGKPYVFDSIECLIDKLHELNNEKDMAYLLVADYSNPGTLIDAQKANYLISEKIKSPMGANLSAFKSLDEAKKTQQKYGGQLYNWSELKKKFAN